MDNRLHPLRASQRLLTYLVCGLIAWQPLLPAISATINPVTSGTNMDKAANGVPVVNIATPNGAGISHNQFKDYNVGKEGLILNNATGQLNKTQLGGYIQNNTNLTAGREAKGIINEVTGGSRSQLQGYTEVAGKAANVIVANPYGITCSGCGFINTPNATLTTGKPVFDAKGNLQSLDVSKGTITVEGQGLDASQSDALAIISRATEVNAAIHAKDLKVVAGANRVGSDGSVTAIAGEGAAPVVAVDTGALGGMYANRIHLVSGEKGVGVNLGNLNARQGDITLDANGKLVLNNSLSSGELTAKAESVELGGDNKAAGNATVSAQNGIALNGGSLVSDKTVALDGGESVQLSGAKVTAGEDIRLAGAELNIDKNSTADAAGDIGLTAKTKAASLNAQSDATGAESPVVQDKVNNAGQLTAGENITLNTDTAANSGSLVAKGSFTGTAKQLTNRGKLVGDTLVTDSDTLNNHGEMLAGQKLKITANSISQGGTVSVKGNADIAARDSLMNAAGGSISSDNGLTVKTAQLINSGTLSAANLGLESDVTTNGGLLQGTQSLSLLSNSLNNQKAGSIATAGDLVLNLPDFTNSGLLSGGGALQLSGDRLTNSGEINATSLISDNSAFNNLSGGKVLATGAMQLTNAQLDNAGQLAADQLELNAGTLNNSGTVQGSGSLNLKADTLTNQNGGELLTGGKLSLTSSELANDGLLQGGTLDVTADNWRNGGNALSAQDATVKVTDTLTNNGKILGQQKLGVEAANTDNSGWLAAQVLTLHSDLVNSGLLQGTDGLTLQGGVLTSNNSGQILTSGQATVTADTLENSGTIQADTLALDAQTLTNRGQWTANNLTLKGGSLDNDGAVNAISSLTAQLTGKLTQQQNKTLQSGGLLKLSAAETDNRGRLQGSSVQLDGAVLTNSGWLQATDLILNVAKAGNTGTLLAEQQATLTGDTLTNSGTVQADNLTADYQQLTNNGTLLGSSDLTLTGGQISQQAAGKLFSGGNLALTSNGFDQLGQVVVLGNVMLKLADGLTSAGTIAAGKTLDITTGGALTSNGVLQGETVALKATGALNNGGQITGGSGALTLNGGSITSSGTVQGGGDTNLTSNSNITLNGFTGAGGTVTLNAPGTIVNTALLYAANNLYLLADKIQNQGGDILAGNSLWMQRDAAGNANTEIVNSSGTIETQDGDITIKTGHLLNTRTGLSVQETTKTLPNLPAGIGGSTIRVRLGDLSEEDGELGYFKDSIQLSGGKDDTHYYFNALAPTEKARLKRYLVSQILINATAEGGAGVISANRNLSIVATNLDNHASDLLAGKNFNLSGAILNNASWSNSVKNEYLNYRLSSGTYLATHELAAPANVYANGAGRRGEGVNSRVIYNLVNAPEYETSVTGPGLRAVIQAGGNLTATFSSNISNTSTTANAGGFGKTLTTPVLNTLSTRGIGETQQAKAADSIAPVTVDSSALRDQLGNALQKFQGTNINTGAYPLPASDNGYFVTSGDPKSPYLITVNPALDGIGQLDQNVYGDLYKLLGQQPANAPQETRTEFTDKNAFLGSAYMLGRLNLNPEYDYRFLGDAAFDTRYVSNTILNQTGNRYLNGIGSDLDQMRYLMDNAASAQQSLGLQFGVSLSADQIASLDKSLLWWETTTINGETVMVPKVYLSSKDVSVSNGSVIAANNISLDAGGINNNGSTLSAQNTLSAESQNTINNLNDGAITAGSGLQLSALRDINNLSAAISGKTVALESTSGSINNVTLDKQWSLDETRKSGSSFSASQTYLGTTASITSQDSLTLNAGKNITLTGASMSAGSDMLLSAQGDVVVNANHLDNRFSQSEDWWREKVVRNNVSNQASTISAGNNLVVRADNNVAITASDISAARDATLAAGNDISLNTLKNSQASGTGRADRNGYSESSSSGIDNTAITSGGNLTLTAGRDLTSLAAALAAEGDVTLQAARDVTLQSEASSKGSNYKSSSTTEIKKSVRQQGTEIAAGGDVAILAGRDLNSKATQVVAQQDIAVAAGNNVNLDTATESDYYYKKEVSKGGGFLSKKTTTTIQEDTATREKGTLLSGNNVSVEAGKNILVNGSQVVGDDEVALKAGDNIDIVAATNTNSSWRFSETKKSGLMGTGGIGISIGSSKSTHDLKQKGTTQSQSVSTVGSTGGNVTITSGGQTLVNGADLVAGKNLSVSGDSVVVTPGHDKNISVEKFEQKTSGLTLALSGAVGEAINSAVASAQAAKEESNGRLAALQATKTVLSGAQAVLAGQQAQVTGDPNNGVGISISLTTQRSKSEQHQETDTVNPSTLNAGNNLSVTATGNGSGDNSGNVAVSASQLKAGGDTTLNAANDILLTGAANTQKTTGNNSSSGGGVGISFGVGSGSAGLSIFANVNAAKGSEKGNGTSWTETTVDSGGTVALNSGRDTTLTGAQVNGDKVTADVGRDLTITSQQDSDDYNSKQTSVSAGGSFTFGSMTGSGYIGVSQDKMRNNYDSVIEQSGIYAGKGGFDLTVGEHTQLNGGVIASQGAAADNRLDTGTLGFTDIHNEADYKVSHSGMNVAVGGGASMLSNAMSNVGNVLAGLNGSGHAEGTTQSAVADGTIIIRDQANQKQDVADLSRDTENANGSISPIFDKEKEQKRLQASQLVGEISGQMATLVNTWGDIEAMKEANKTLGPVPAGLDDKARAAEVEKRRNSEAYQAAIRDYGIGSKNQMVVQAISGVLQGLVSGNISQAVAGGVSPLMAQTIKAYTTNPDNTVNETANLMAHAVWGAVAAQMSGGNAAAGAAGAFSAELAARYIAEYRFNAKTPEEISKLSESDRQEISLLSTLAAGAAGGLIGDSTAAVTTGAQTGKNAVENNYLSSTQALAFDKELDECRQSGGDCTAVIEKWKQVSDKQSAQVDERLENSPITAQGWDKEVAQGGYDMTNRPGWLSNIGADVMTSDEAKAYVQQWNGQDLSNIDVNSPAWTKFAVFISEPENQTAVGSLGILGKNLVVLAKTTVSNLFQGGASTSIKSMQVGLRNPQQVDQIKDDMVSGNYRFTSPEGRIAGYIDSKGNYYISEGNHRMVAAQEIYKKTGDASYIDNLLKNGSWTQTTKAPAGASSMPTRK